MSQSSGRNSISEGLKNFLRVLVVVILSVLPCQTATGTCGQSNAGYSFIATFMQSPSSLTKSLALYAGSTGSAVNVTVLLNRYFSTSIQIPVNEQARINIAFPFELGNQDVSAILLTGNDSFTLVGLTEQGNYSEAYLGLPLNGLGRRYFVVSYTSQQGNDANSAQLVSQFAVAAVDDNTEVIVILSKMFVGQIQFRSVIYGAGDRFSFRLNYLDVVQLNSTSDLTGTEVTSNNRIAVWAGNEVARFDANTQNYVVEQMIPVEPQVRWMSFYVPPLPGGGAYAVKVVAAFPDTTINIVSQGTDPNAPNIEARTLLASGDYTTLYQTTKGLIISTANPIIVCQLTSSSSSPAMTVVPPGNRNLSQYKFVVPASTLHSFNVSTILVTLNTTDLQYDDHSFSASPTTWDKIPGSAYQVTSLATSISGNLTHLVRSRSGTTFLEAFVYGWSQPSNGLASTTYFYPAGICLDGFGLPTGTSVPTTPAAATASSLTPRATPTMTISSKLPTRPPLSMAKDQSVPLIDFFEVLLDSASSTSIPTSSSPRPTPPRPPSSSSISTPSTRPTPIRPLSSSSVSTPSTRPTPIRPTSSSSVSTPSTRQTPIRPLSSSSVSTSSPRITPIRPSSISSTSFPIQSVSSISSSSSTAPTVTPVSSTSSSSRESRPTPTRSVSGSTTSSTSSPGASSRSTRITPIPTFSSPVTLSSLPTSPGSSTTSLPVSSGLSTTSLPASPGSSTTGLPISPGSSTTNLPLSTTNLPDTSTTNLPVSSTTIFPASFGSSTTNLPGSTSLPISPGLSTTNLPVSGSSTTIFPVSPGSSTTNLPVSPGSSTTNLPVSPGSSTTNLPVSSGSSTTNLPVSPGLSTTNLPVSPGSSTTNLPVSPGSSTTNLPLSPGSSSTNLPVSPDSSTTNFPVSSGSSTTSLPMSSGSSQTNLPTSSGLSTASFSTSSGSSTTSLPFSLGSSTTTFPTPSESSTTTFPTPSGSSTTSFPTPSGSSETTFPTPSGSSGTTFPTPSGSSETTVSTPVASGTFTATSGTSPGIPTFGNVYSVPIPKATSPGQVVEIFMVNTSPMPVQVVITYLGSNYDLIIPANGETSWTATPPTNGQDIAIALINSTAPIFVTTLQHGSCSAYLPLANSALGTEYQIVTWNSNSYFTITTVDQPAAVRVSFPSSSSTCRITSGNVSFFCGDDFQVFLDPGTARIFSSSADLSGTYIESDVPVSVIAGTLSNTRIGTGDIADSTVSELFPVYAWGQNFTVPSVPNNDGFGFYLKISSGWQPASIRVLTTGVPTGTPYTIQAYGTLLLNFPDNRPLLVVANVSIQVLQFVKSSTTGSSARGAPAELTIPSIERFTNTYAFGLVPGFSNFITIIIERSSASGLLLNGQPAPQETSTSRWQDVGPSGSTWIARSFELQGSRFAMVSHPTVNFGAFRFSYNFSSPPGDDSCELAYPAGAMFPSTQNLGSTTPFYQSTTLFDISSSGSTTSPFPSTTFPGTNPSLTTSSPQDASSLFVQDCTCLNVSTALQPTYNGYYYLFNRTLNGQEVYKRLDCDVYLFFYRGTGASYWIYGPSLGVNRGMLLNSGVYGSVESAIRWEGYNSTSGAFQEDPSYNDVCSCPATACISVEFLNSTVTTSIFDGVFFSQKTTFNGRPVFRHQSQSLYLYFFLSDTCQRWVVGSKVGDPTGVLYIDDRSTDVTDIDLVADWRYFTGSGFVSRPEVELTCYQATPGPPS